MGPFKVVTIQSYSPKVVIEDQDDRTILEFSPSFRFMAEYVCALMNREKQREAQENEMAEYFERERANEPR